MQNARQADAQMGEPKNGYFACTRYLIGNGRCGVSGLAWKNEWNYRKREREREREKQKEMLV